MCKSLKDVYEKQQSEAAKRKSQEEKDGKLDVNSNHVNEDQPEAAVGDSREHSAPGDSVEGERRDGVEAGLASAQDAPSGPQQSEEWKLSTVAGPGSLHPWQIAAELVWLYLHLLWHCMAQWQDCTSLE